MAGRDLLEKAKAASSEKGRKRAFEDKKSHFAPWDTTPAHCQDLTNGRSKLEDKTLEEFWGFVSHETEILKYRTECPCL